MLLVVAAMAPKVFAAQRDLRFESFGDTAAIGHPEAIFRIYRNLIDNAMKYGSRTEPVRVTVRPSDASYELTVADRGEGIAPEHLPHLTRRFYRTDPGRSRAAGGTGLGLAIVKHIVERHRGRLDIASELGSGTTITVRLPRHVEDESNQLGKTFA